MPTVLVGARILTPDEDVPKGNVILDKGRIIAVGPDAEPPVGAVHIEAKGLTLVPGFIDLHVHGGGGFSLLSRDPDEIRRYACWVVARGVTSFLAAVSAESHEEALAFLRTAANMTGPISGGANLLGLHLEGPFLNPERRGALPPGWLRPANLPDLEAYLEAAAGHLAILTLAPELPGAREVVEAALAKGIVVSMGHTDATYEEARAAIDWGVGLATHVFNAMRPFHHREPGPLGAILESGRVTAELIADGVHVHPAALRFLLQAKGPKSVALVTDGVPPARLSEGGFRLGEQEARLEGGRVVLADGTIAGSAATMDQVVRNVVQWGLCSLQDAVRMASTVPAHVLGLAHSKGRIAPGYHADLVALDEALEVTMTWVAGEMLRLRPKG